MRARYRSQATGALSRPRLLAISKHLSLFRVSSSFPDYKHNLQSMRTCCWPLLHRKIHYADYSCSLRDNVLIFPWWIPANLCDSCAYQLVQQQFVWSRLSISPLLNLFWFVSKSSFYLRRRVVSMKCFWRCRWFCGDVISITSAEGHELSNIRIKILPSG